MVQYLFGELSAEERAEFEDAYLRDSTIFHELVALENELIDQYILGELSQADQTRFERSFLANPDRCNTVETARSLLNYSAAAANAESPKFGSKVMPWHASRVAQLAAAVVFLVMLGGISWLAVSNRTMANELTKLKQERASVLESRRALEQQIEGLKADLLRQDDANRQMVQLMQDMVPFTLEPAVSRGNGKSTGLVIPPHVAYVFLRVLLRDDSHSHYSLSIRTADGRPVWKQGNLQGTSNLEHRKELAVTVPSRLLRSGDYVLKIYAGTEDILHTVVGYSFQVTHKSQYHKNPRKSTLRF